MKSITGVDLKTVQAVYSGPEGDLWELIMGEQIHIGGLTSSIDLAERAGIGEGMQGVDLCCCNGGGMRFLVRFRNVAHMKGVDATRTVLDRGRGRCAAQDLNNCIEFILAEATATGLPDSKADFVWGEDAWCYVENKEQLITEAVRLLKPGGTVAFTDWVEGATPLTDAEAERLLRFMKFPNIQDIAGYQRLLKKKGCKIVHAEDTGRFAKYVDLYLNMIGMQLTGDALRIIGFDSAMLEFLATEMVFMQQLAHAGKIVQGRFIAKK